MALPFLLLPKKLVKLEDHPVMVIFKLQPTIQRFKLEISGLFQKSHLNYLTKPSTSIPYMQQNSSVDDPVV
jgi:hypothetical protein